MVVGLPRPMELGEVHHPLRAAVSADQLVSGAPKVVSENVLGFACPVELAVGLGSAWLARTRWIRVFAPLSFSSPSSWSESAQMVRSWTASLWGNLYSLIAVVGVRPPRLPRCAHGIRYGCRPPRRPQRPCCSGPVCGDQRPPKRSSALTANRSPAASPRSSRFPSVAMTRPSCGAASPPRPQSCCSWRADRGDRDRPHSQLGRCRGRRFHRRHMGSAGTGNSYDALEPTSTVTVDQMVTDTIEVTDYVRARFDEQKVYLVGSSWGTIHSARCRAAYHGICALFIHFRPLRLPGYWDCCLAP